jgi:hypothetical protein
MTPGPHPAGQRIPLAVKLIYTAFMAVLVPSYWLAYGPTNFLFFCDIALFFALAALWLESPLLASMPAVGILVPQTFWVIDFLAAIVGLPNTGTTGYMFNSDILLYYRGLSLFHFWLPFLLLWMVWRLGYDGRALAGWTLLTVPVLLICYFLMPEPPAPQPQPGEPHVPANINYVYGFGETAQTWMHPLAWLAGLIVGMPLVCYVPAHFFLRWAFPRPAK